MKKIILILTIISIQIMPVIAVDNSGIPQWLEFCPREYYNADYKLIDNDELQEHAIIDTTKLYCHSSNKFVDVTSKVLILPALDCWTATKIRKNYHKNEYIKFNQNLDYWNARKKAFDLNIKTCNLADTNTRAMCYMQVREIERQKNKDLVNSAYNEAILNEQRARSIQQTNQLMQINQQLYNLNSQYLYK